MATQQRLALMVGADARLYLWYKSGGAQGLPMVLWDVCIMPKDEEGFGLIDVATQGSIVAAKMADSLFGGVFPMAGFVETQIAHSSAYWQDLRAFGLCDIILAP
jgi:hypothetical protein